MLPFQFLDMVDGLTRLDPVRTYPARAGELLARMCGADGFIVELEGAERVTGGDLNEERARVELPLRYGRQNMGQIILYLSAGRERLEAHDLRTARWAARMMGRCLSYAARMRQETRKHGPEDVSEALLNSPLTPRERDVVGLLVSGASTRRIAVETHLTVGTVHTYLKRIYPKMGVRSRVELVARLMGTNGMLFAHRDEEPEGLQTSEPVPTPAVMN